MKELCPFWLQIYPQNFVHATATTLTFKQEFFKTVHATFKTYQDFHIIIHVVGWLTILRIDL